MAAPALYDHRAVDDRESIVTQLRRAIERRDADQIAQLLHPDVVLRLYSAGEPIRGRERARAWYAEAFRRRIVFEGNAQVEPRDPNRFVMRGRVYWVDASDGGRDQSGEWEITFRDGLIASITADRPAPGA